MKRSELVKQVYVKVDDEFDLSMAAVENVLNVLADITLLKPREISEAWAEMTKEALARNTESFNRGFKKGVRS